MKKHPPLMTDALMAAGSSHAESAYEALLRDESKYGRHEFLLQAVKRGYLGPAERAVITDLIKGKIKPPSHRPPKVETRLKAVSRALRVLDLEQNGWPKRESALAQAQAELGCQRRSLQKALAEHEEWLRGASPELLHSIRAFSTTLKFSWVCAHSWHPSTPPAPGICLVSSADVAPAELRFGKVLLGVCPLMAPLHSPCARHPC